MAGSYRVCTVASATVVGVDAVAVSVEIVVSNGLPGFAIVGMTDVAIQEARERVKAAIRACGYTMPNEKVVVNLAPGFLKKSGSGFDLPIAVGLLVATGQVPKGVIEGCLMVGELSLDGGVRPVRGMLAYQELALQLGYDLLCAPMTAYGSTLASDVIRVADTLSAFRNATFGTAWVVHDGGDAASLPDFRDVGGHEEAKRALQIAAAGELGLLMMGPPGSGKTMLASRLPSILPPLDENEVLESAKICSIVGEDASTVLRGVRPFRAPHHSATAAGLCGGGSPVRPGEITLAHNGVLFLDELPEFRPSVLQMLRKPVEEGKIVITRADGNVVLPSRFMLVAASNPCPCGYYGDPDKECACSLQQVTTYQNRIGGPLVDRFDMCLDVWRSDFRDVVREEGDIDSATLREGVIRAREFASWRKEREGAVHGSRSTKAMLRECRMDEATERFLEEAAGAHAMSGRAICSTLRVARTIADIDEKEHVEFVHVAEALNLRLRNGE